MCVWNVEPRMGSGLLAGKPTVREAQSPSGNATTREANAGSRKATGKRDMVAGASCWPSRITGRIPGLGPGPERGLTRVGWTCGEMMSKDSEPKGKLDAATSVVVNGPEDAPVGWREVDWRQAERDVAALRRRIFTASRAGDLASVRSPAEVDVAFARERAAEREACERA